MTTQEPAPLSLRAQVPAPSSLQGYIREIEKYPQLSPEEERLLALAYYEKGDKEAAKKLVLSHLRYALSLAMRYQHLAPLMDLIQEANLGLMEAVKRFNPYQGFRLSTYATYWIREHLQRYLQHYQNIVRRGTTREERKVQRELPRVLREAARKGNGEPSIYEIAEALKVSPLTVQAMTRRNEVELDALYGEDEEASLHNLIPAAGNSPLEEIVENEEKSLIQKSVAEFYRSLAPREKEIFSTRILGAKPGITLAKLAAKYRVSRERIRQIELRLRKRFQEFLKTTLETGQLPALPAPTPPSLPAPQSAPEP